jgi:hypothetical protein
MMFRFLAGTFAFLLLATSLSAHPGHGVNPAGNDALHYVLELPHLAIWAAAAAAFYAISRLGRRVNGQIR